MRLRSSHLSGRRDVSRPRRREAVSRAILVTYDLTASVRSAAGHGSGVERGDGTRESGPERALRRISLDR